MGKMVELSDGAAHQDLSTAYYEALPTHRSLAKNPRNWVDVYETFNLMWFFDLRAEDGPASTPSGMVQV